MKKSILILAMTVTTFSLCAQTEQTYTQMFDSLFSNVPYSTVTSGILYDRVVGFSNLGQLNDTSSYTRFIQAYSELNRAVTNLSINQQFLLETDSLKKRLQNIPYIPIGIINATYDIIDTNALHSGKLYESNGLFYVNNAINGTLFVQEYTLLAAPLSKEVDSVVTFGVSNLFLFENSTIAVSTVSIDFDDGNGINNYAIGNTNIVVQYATEGEKTITIQIHLSNGSIVTTYARLQVVISKTPKTHKDLNDYVVEEPITAKISYLGVYGQAKIQYRYQNSLKQLQKPVMIVTGFDPLNQENFERARERMNYQENGQEQNLMDKLFGLGYDIVIVDFPNYTSGGQDIKGGGDYIQRNAYTVIEVINELNRKLAASGSEHQLVIIGPSMGGQITRYALRYMEKYPGPLTNNGKHNCRLWISFDSPHQGANMPYGGQAFLDYYGNQVGLDAAKPYYEAYLMAPAGKQMLIHHLKCPYTPGTSLNLTSQVYYNEINTLGFPSNLRKIAVTNGSLNGTTTGWAEREVLHLFHTFSIGSWQVGEMDVAQIWLAPEYGNTNKVFLGKYQPKSTGSWLTITESSYSMTSLSNTCCIDAAPGSTFPTIRMIKEATDNLDMIRSKYTQLYQGDHCFMPVKSTLAYTGSNKNYCDDISGICLVQRGETPFDSYTGPIGKNMEHVSYDADIADYVRKEIETYITGPRKLDLNLCSENTNVYSLHLPAGTTANITWSSSNNIAIIPGNSPTEITVYALGSGDGWISAEVSSLTRSHRLANYPITINASTNPTYPQYTTISNVTVNGSSETWSKIMKLTHPFKIENGKTLTISSIIHCAPTAKIIVQPGGKLIVEGGVLTNLCDESLWQGIEIEGNYKDWQNPTDKLQGVVVVHNDAKIMNAVCGIHANAGGCVYANNAHFINNQQAVYFAPYDGGCPPTGTMPYHNVSYFSNCEFRLDNNALFTQAYTQAELHSVHGISFSNCTFADDRDNNLSCTGIYANESAIIVGYLPRWHGGWGRRQYAVFQVFSWLLI